MHTCAVLDQNTSQVSKAQADTGDNHSISALKFGIIRKFLTVGWAVLLSDIDIAVLQNPFKFLYRRVGLYRIEVGPTLGSCTWRTELPIQAQARLRQVTTETHATSVFARTSDTHACLAMPQPQRP